MKMNTLERPPPPAADLPPPSLQVALQAHWVRKQGGVPCEVSLPVSMFDVQPHDVVGDPVDVETRIHGLHVCLVPVIPAALVVPQGKQWGQRLVP